MTLLPMIKCPGCHTKTEASVIHSKEDGIYSVWHREEVIPQFRIKCMSCDFSTPAYPMDMASSVLNELRGEA